MLLFSLGSISAACSLGANPLSMEAKAKPGQEVVGTWNLYNLYGDRTTHIIIEKIQGPDWEITFDPALHEASYEVSGEIRTIDENIALEESSVVLEIPENPPEEVDYVKHPNQEGYIPVKPTDIYITIPEDAEIGTTYNVVVSFTQVAPSGEGGMLRVAGAITTHFPVEVVGTGESSLLEGQPTVTEPEKAATSFWIPAILILIIIVLIALIRRSRK